MAVAAAPAAGEAPIVTAYRRRLHEVHRLAALLDALVRDPRLAGPPALPVELRDELADAVEILTEVRDLLPT